VVRGAADEPHVARTLPVGRLVRARGEHGLFLRWPALDMPLGGLALSELNRAHDWDSFRAGLACMTNAPMLAVYADRHGHIGQQAVGLIPRRSSAIGSLVLSLDDPSHAWTGYHEFSELPSELDPPEGRIAYANQYSVATFAARPHLSNRWHPPTRALRIDELLGARPRHDVASACAIQDDRIDGFARDHVQYLTSLLPAPSSLATWDGDTRDTTRALLFERWFAALTVQLTRSVLPVELADRYADLWPGHRWNVIAILRDHASDWGITDVPAFVTRAYAAALVAPRQHPRVELRHSLRRSALGRLAFAASYPYDGGTRETIHVARRNTDFLTASQAGKRGAGAYHFGPAFKLVHDLAAGATMHYLANTPARGTPLGVLLVATLRRWRRGLRFVTRLT
jgi:penicillin amidase